MESLTLTPSFGRRKDRKLRAQAQSAYEGVLPSVQLYSFDSPFDKPFPELWLEIGFGGGEHMLERLSQNPKVAMIGCEPFINGVANLLKNLSSEDYERVRIWHEDVRYLLEKTPPQTFDRTFILFPDPWPKKRHHKKRLITKKFMERLLPTLKNEAPLHVASDDVSYVEQIQDVLYGHPQLDLCFGPSSFDPKTWTDRPVGWPQTRYEQKALKQGKKCAYMLFQKKS